MAMKGTEVKVEKEADELAEQLAGITLKSAVGSEVAFVAGGTTLISSSEELEGFKTAISGRTLVAFDAEGVDLSREGRLTLISVGVEVEGGVHVFLLDPIHPEIGLRNDILLNAKNLLEDPGVTKIVHDCRQDSDALYRTLDPPIELKNVFDTQVWAMRLSRSSKRDNLNNTLSNFRCSGTNVGRVQRGDMSSMYSANHAVWATRPLTPKLIAYASQDVHFLFELREAILARVTAEMPTAIDSIAAECQDATDAFRSMLHSRLVTVPPSKRGLVIGRGGSTIAEIERQSGAMMCCPVHPDKWLVIANTAAQVAKAEQIIKRKVNGGY